MQCGGQSGKEKEWIDCVQSNARGFGIAGDRGSDGGGSDGGGSDSLG